MKKRSTVILFFTFLLLQLTACSSGIKGIAEMPQVSVEGVSMRNLSLTEATAVFTLNVFNPNPYPLKANGMDYRMKLNGIEVANGLHNKEILLAKGEKRRLKLPIKLKVSQLFDLVPTFFRERKMAYEVDGSVHMPLFKVPFSKKGGVGLPESYQRSVTPSSK